MKALLAAWLHSTEGAFAGGHFRVTWGLILSGALALSSLWFLSRRGPEREVAPARSSPVLAAGIVGGGVVAAWMYLDHKAPAAQPAAHPVPKPVITRTIVQHVASHPTVPGWGIVVIAVASMVIGLAVVLNIRGK